MPTPDPGLRMVTDAPALKAAVAGLRADGAGRVALVPTMGALHAGHRTLIRMARDRADAVVASVFVNPKQFGPGEDFATYPRDLAHDRAALAAWGVDLLYAPDAAAMYPDGFATTIHVAGLGEGLCGARRPGHFDGVATVVAKLLIQAAPDVAVFGEKDYQQLCVIRRLAADLNLPVEALGCPTARAADGLALSSRNRRLSPAARAVAPALHGALRDVADGARALAAGDSLEPLLAAARAELLSAGFEEVEYLEARADDTLRPMPVRAVVPGRVFAAARLDGVRLMDNVALDWSGKDTADG